MLGNCEQVRPQVPQRHSDPDRLAVADHMQIRSLKIDDLGPGDVLDPGVADVPFVRYRPVEDRGPRRDFVDLKWYQLLQAAQRLPHALPGDAAADRKQVPDQIMNLGTDAITRLHVFSPFLRAGFGSR